MTCKLILINYLEPTDIVPDTLTHILYAFADTSPDTGEIKLTDSYADEEVGLYFLDNAKNSHAYLIPETLPRR
jgi:GH18 family chitinase